LKRRQKLETNVIDLDLCRFGCTKEGVHGMISREVIGKSPIVKLMPAIDCPGDKAQIHLSRGCCQ